MEKGSGVPRAIIPNDLIPQTDEREGTSARGTLMTLGGDLFEQFFQSIAEQLEENAGLNEAQNAELATYLQTNSRSIVEKRDRLGEFLRRLDSEAEAVRSEETRLAARRRAIEKIGECMRSSIFQMLMDAGVLKIEGKLFSFAIRKNPPRVEISDEAAIPPEFISYEPKIDKAGIKAALQAGKAIPGAELQQSSRLDLR